MLAIGGSALALGSVHTITLCVVATVLILSALLAWWTPGGITMRPSAGVLFLTGIALTLYTALQCVPLPTAWLAIITPYNADVWSHALVPLHEAGPRWAPVTLDPVATRVEILKGVTYLFALAAAVRIARRREGVAFLSRAIVANAVILAAAALLHPAFGAHKVFGLYEPEGQVNERHLAPLLDPNNLAGYLNVGLCLALASGMAREPPIPRAMSAAAVVFLGATQLWVASRGGVVAMGLGVLLVVIFVRLAQAPARKPVAILSWATGLGIAVGGTLIVLAGSDDASNELLVGDTSKLTMIFRAARMLRAMPLFGTGRGSFESAYPAFRADAQHVTFAYPENVVMQWTVEWGIPVATLAFIAIAAALRPSAALARSTAVGGAWAALVALTVQNLGDLGSEVPGVVLAGVGCAAMVVAGVPGMPTRSFLQRWLRAPKVLMSTACLIACLIVAITVRDIHRELHEDQRTLYHAAIDDQISRETMHQLARSTMLRHPTEPYLPFSVSLRAWYRRDDNPVPWIAATLERARVYGPAHLFLARALAVRSPSQGRLEYRLAMEQAPELEGIALTEGTRLVHSYYDALELVPTGPDAISVLDQISNLLRDRLPATSVRLNADVLRRAPTRPGPVMRDAEDAVIDAEAEEEAPWCAKWKHPACIQSALTKTVTAVNLVSDECAPHVLHARARIAQGDRGRALEELEAAADTVKDRVPCLQRLEMLASALGSEKYVDVALQKIAAAGYSDDVECAHALTWVAQREDERGNASKAFLMYKRAYERAPDDDEVLASVANHARNAGLHGEAATDFAKLAEKHPEQAVWRQAEAQEREAAIKAAVGLTF